MPSVLPCPLFSAPLLGTSCSFALFVHKMSPEVIKDHRALPLSLRADCSSVKGASGLSGFWILCPVAWSKSLNLSRIQFPCDNKGVDYLQNPSPSDQTVTLGRDLKKKKTNRNKWKLIKVEESNDLFWIKGHEGRTICPLRHSTSCTE